MNGVILWSDAAEQKAVIWCEDHGDLAFLSRNENAVLPDTYFSVGDVVEFDLQIERNLRLACNPVLIKQDAGKSLCDGLNSITVHACDVANGTATVIPFPVDHPKRPVVGTLRHQQRHG
ncbi:hypothetical protein [Tateyamaria sp.]|uniref:hypothetical protein n=1 Tax=Tateyamaria sp. TaxID=1929288 RepID=UPI00329B860E